MACRLHQSARTFDQAAQNLARTAQVHRSGERLRQVVESEGRAVQKAPQAGGLVIGWTAADCAIPTAPPAAAAPTTAPPGLASPAEPDAAATAQPAPAAATVPGTRV
jgi:hypothetical protein